MEPSICHLVLLNSCFFSKLQLNWYGELGDGKETEYGKLLREEETK